MTPIKKYINLKLKFLKKEIIRRIGPLTGTVLLLWCLNHLSSASLTSLRSGLRNIFMLDRLCTNAIIIFVLSFSNRRERRIYETKFPTPVRFLFQFSICRVTLTVVISEIGALKYVVLSKEENKCVMGNWLVTQHV